MWYVVLFPQEDSVSVIPVSWYVEKTQECLWPPQHMKTTDVDKFIRHRYLPQDDWKPYKANILGKYGDYKEALIKLGKAKEKDKLSSTDNEDIGRGKRKIIPKYQNSSSSASEADESASDDGLSFPNFLNHNHKHSATEVLENNINLKVQTTQKRLTSNSINKRHQRARSIAADADGRRRKPFSRKLSRSLSPENLGSNEKSLQSDQHIIALDNPNKECSISKRFNDNCGNYSQKPPSTTISKYTFLESLLPERAQSCSNSTLDEHNSITTVQSSENPSLQVLSILQKMQADNTEFRVQILRKLNLMNMKLNDVENSLGVLLNNKTDIQAEETEDQFNNWFPLNIEKLENLELFLENETNKKQLIKHLSRVGGSDLPEAVKRLMYKIFTNEAGTSFSWDGAKGKRKFKNLKLADVILNVVRANKNTKNATDSDIIIHIKKWLVRSKDRIINKKSRQNQNQTVVDPDEGNQVEPEN